MNSAGLIGFEELPREIRGQLDGKPCPIEISAVTLYNAQNWKNPGSCVFHDSDFWKEKHLMRFWDPDAEVYVVDHEFPDPDVTSYIRVVLCGAPIEAVFAPVSDEDFWAAISNEAEAYDFHSYAPRYLASNVLILGRILSFKMEKKILSKYEAGLWMMRNLPPEFTELIENTMKIWYEGKTCTLPEKELEKLRLCLIEKIKK